MHSAHIPGPLERRTANLLGALALALGDRMKVAMTAAAERGPTATAAILSLHGWPGRNIEELRGALEISHSAAVRLIDRLEAEGIVRRVRDAAADARTVLLLLTPAGERQADLVLAARERALADVLAQALDDTQTAVLAGHAARLLATLSEGSATMRRICRCCDLQTCTDCPVEAAGASRPRRPRTRTSRPGSSRR